MNWRSHRTLLVLLVIALLLRLGYGLAQDQLAVYENQGNDSWFYLMMGRNLTTGFDYSEISLPTAPLYLIFNGVWQNILPEVGAVIGIRVTQALMSTAMAFFVYRLAVLITDDERAGLVAVGLVAVGPIFIIEAAQVGTESLYNFLALAGCWLYVEFVHREKQRPTLFWMGLVGVLLGMATLTRAVLLLFPLGLAIHLFMISKWRVALRRALVLLIVYTLTVGTWTFHNLYHWGRFVIAAEGFAAFLYIGATDWEGPSQVDENLARDAGVEGNLPGDVGTQQELYREAAANVILGDPLGYIQHRVSNLLGAVLQPHGTLLFGGAGIKELISDWLRENRTAAGLIDLTRSPGFWPKLVLYIFHFMSLIAGLAGLWLTRRRWRLTLPLAGFILYTLLIHLVFDAIPRYIFPTSVFWWVFAGIALAALSRKTVKRDTAIRQAVVVE